ncbi:Hint domain-containing protein [Aliiroseovarius marinus]|uniref:Hint domain-containing protein n=1 Tax=Aliiroseovarius marinus TaxID=2500159 RepID=UPI0024949C2F|nr:Hint domain-containing protein [Aliiroseovarius marinus]
MATYSTNGWVFTGTGTPTTLVPVTIEDDDLFMSPYLTDDFSEKITINGTTYTNPRGGTYELTFVDSNGVTHTEELYAWYTGSSYIFVPKWGSAFDDGSIVLSTAGFVEFETGFEWAEVVGPPEVTCFTAGTLIETPCGPVAIERMCAGELVLTADGVKAVRWIGQSPVSRMQLAANPKLFPIRITAGALGVGLPKRDLLVSRQHRMLVQSPIARRMFGTSDVLVHAIKLTALPGIYVDQSVAEVTYYHMLFDDHQVVYAEGAPSESLYTGPEALKAISDEARDEVLALFPELADRDYTPEFATFAPDGKRQKKLVARHLKNGKPLLSHC